MNYWLALSIEYANERNYLDNLFEVYPTNPGNNRELDSDIWEEFEKSFHQRNDLNLINSLLKLDLFPIKDSYVAYLRGNPSAIQKNPETVNRLCRRIYDMGLEKTREHATEPKETNRQIGPLFRRWVRRKSLGVTPVKLNEFTATNDNAILDASDAEMKNFAKDYLNYTLDKGLDFVARFNGKYVIGEAKFLTDSGGHQNAQFNDAIAPLLLQDLKAVPVAILDGVLYIRNKTKMHKLITNEYRDKNILSSLVLREFLSQV